MRPELPLLERKPARTGRKNVGDKGEPGSAGAAGGPRAFVWLREQALELGGGRAKVGAPSSPSSGGCRRPPGDRKDGQRGGLSRGAGRGDQGKGERRASPGAVREARARGGRAAVSLPGTRSSRPSPGDGSEVAVRLGQESKGR